MDGANSFYSVHNLWQNIRRELGEYNSVNNQKEKSQHFFDTRRKEIEFPQKLLKPVRHFEHNPDDPFGYLGRIGYTKNNYQFAGPNREDNNIYGSNHMKKTLWLEEMRRRIISDEIGISPEFDDTSIAGTADAYYLDSKFQEQAPRPKSRAAKNKYYNGGRSRSTINRHRSAK